MKKTLALFMILITVTAMFAVKLVPSFEYRSDSEHVAGLIVDFDSKIFDLNIEGEYLLSTKELDVFALARIDGPAGVVKIGVGLDTLITDFASPTLGFIYNAPELDIKILKIGVDVGSGDYKNVLFAKKVLGDLLTNAADISGVVTLKTGFDLSDFKLDASVGAGYYLLEQSYSVFSTIEGNIFDIVDVLAKFDIVPTFAFSVKVSSVIEF